MSFFKWKPLTEAEEKRVLGAIASAELETSGEIRVHIDKWCKTDPVFKANNLFCHLEMEATKDSNGVLIYIAKKEHKFAIVGDIGIDKVVPTDFWETTNAIMKKHFAVNQLAEGLEAGIAEIGVQLKEYFPHQGEDDVNELPDEISYG